MKKGLSIKWKFIIFILPIVIISLNVLALTISSTSKKIILERTDKEMMATLGEHTNFIGDELDVIKAKADQLAAAYAINYSTMTPDQIKEICVRTANSSDTILGSGVWFEPNVYDAEQKYYGPYWYKDGGEIVETWDYSNAEYDYFAQEYYTTAKGVTSAIITDPYYDETSGLMMATCAAPIIDNSGKYLGCVSVDLMKISDDELKEIADYIALAKELRKTVQLGTAYNLMSIYNGNLWCREYVSKDGEEVLVFIFAPQLTFTYCFPSIKLYGLDKNALYSVDGEYTMSGEGLMNKGIDSKVYCLGNMGCKLIRIKKI